MATPGTRDVVCQRNGERRETLARRAVRRVPAKGTFAFLKQHLK
jgi:hypothetical protein